MKTRFWLALAGVAAVLVVLYACFRVVGADAQEGPTSTPNSSHPLPASQTGDAGPADAGLDGWVAEIAVEEGMGTDDPVAFADVFVYEVQVHEASSSGPRLLSTGVAGADGMIRVPIPQGVLRINVVAFMSSPGTRFGNEYADAVADGGSAGVVVRIPAGLEVSGRVVDEQGAGVPGASVTLIDHCAEFRSAIRPDRFLTVADSDGRFRFQGVQPLSDASPFQYYTAQAEKDGWQCGGTLVRRTEADSIEHRIVLTPVSDPTEIAWRFDQVVPDGARVVLVGSVESGSAVARRAIEVGPSDDRGTYRVSVRPLASGEAFSLFLCDPGLAPSRWDVGVLAGRSLDLGTLHVDLGVTVTIAVVDQSGRMVDGVEVLVRPLLGPEAQIVGSVTLTTDFQGTVRFQASDLVPYRISIPPSEGFLTAGDASSWSGMFREGMRVSLWLERITQR